MKFAKSILIVAAIQVCLFITGSAQFAEPAVTGANYVPNQVQVGSNSVFTVSFANSGSTAIPANSIELTIAYPETYYASNGTSAPTGTIASSFNWVFVAPNIWRGTNNTVIPAFGGGSVILQIKGVSITQDFETTNVNVQPVASFGSFFDAPNNNNLQPKMKVLQATTLADADGDGVSDTQEGTDGTNPNDGCSYKSSSQVLANVSSAWSKLDCDNDGLNNGEESTGTNDPATPSDPKGITDPKDADTDNDGFPDNTDSKPVDTDNDGDPNATDPDDDGDGIPDANEPGKDQDTDNDGQSNDVDTDDDGDGIPDATEGTTDTDGDGKPDIIDTDSDGDGIPDATEGTTDTDGDGKPDNKDTDSDGDGIPDATEGTTDTDGDGKPDYKDTDADGDGIPDATEGTTDTDGDGKPDNKDTDADGDGIPDATEGTTDTDGDGKPDYKDTDADGDGVPDSLDQCPKVAANTTNGCPATNCVETCIPIKIVRNKR
jgi:hypothetical protein